MSELDDFVAWAHGNMPAGFYGELLDGAARWRTHLATEPLSWAPSGATYVCDVPPNLGCVTALRVQEGKVVASTESGIEMIVPVGASGADDEPREPASDV